MRILEKNETWDWGDWVKTQKIPPLGGRNFGNSPVHPVRGSENRQKSGFLTPRRAFFGGRGAVLLGESYPSFTRPYPVQ